MIENVLKMNYCFNLKFIDTTSFLYCLCFLCFNAEILCFPLRKFVIFLVRVALLLDFKCVLTRI